MVIAITEAGPTMQSQVLRPTSSYQFELKEDWFVETDQVGPEMHEWDPLFFVGAGGFPSIGQSHDREPTLRFRTFDSMVMERIDRYIFRGMTWSTSQRPFADDYQQNRFDNALKASRSWKFMAIQKPVTRAYAADPTGPTKFNRPVPASAFSPAPQMPASRLGELYTGMMETEYISVCTYTRNELDPPATLITGPMIGSVNSDDIFVDGLFVPRETCLIKDLTVSDVKQGNNSTAVPFEFRTVKYELAINPRGWDIEVLHTGFFEYRDDIDLFGDPGVVAPITVQSGASPDGQPLKRQRPSKPQAIDVNAAYFTSVESDTKYYDANWRDRLHWRVFRTKRFTPFSGLNFS